MNLATLSRAQLQNLLMLAIAADERDAVIGIMHELLTRDVHDYETSGFNHEESEREMRAALDL